MKNDLLFVKLKYEINYTPDIEIDNNTDVYPTDQLIYIHERYGDVALFAYFNLLIEFRYEYSRKIKDRKSLWFISNEELHCLREDIDSGNFGFTYEVLDSTVEELLYYKFTEKEILDHFYCWFAISDEIFNHE